MSELRTYWQRYFGTYITEDRARDVDALVRFIASHPGACTPKRLENDFDVQSKDLRDLSTRGIIRKVKDGRDVLYEAVDHGYPEGTDPIGFWPVDFQVVMSNLRAKGSMTPPELRTLGPGMLNIAQKLANTMVVEYRDGVYSYPGVVA